MPVRSVFDRRLRLEFHGSRITSDAGRLACRERDDALGLTALAGDPIADGGKGKNGWHGQIGLLHQSVDGRLAGYEHVNDADRLGRDSAMRRIVGGKAVERGGASTGSERRPPRHDRRDGDLRADHRTAATGIRLNGQNRPTPLPIGPSSQGIEAMHPWIAGALPFGWYRVTLQLLGGLHIGNPG